MQNDSEARSKLAESILQAHATFSQKDGQPEKPQDIELILRKKKIMDPSKPINADKELMIDD